jgi:hypothetical protein
VALTRVWTIAIALAASLVAGAAPASALAAQRFASPGGSGTTCSAAAPCSLVTAVNNAVVGDEVIVAGDQGTYGTSGSPIPTQLTDAGGINLHGAAGQPMPVAYFNVPADNAIALNAGGTLSDLHVENLAANGSGALLGNGGDHLYLSGGGQGCEPSPGTTLIDTVCVGGGTGIGLSVSTGGVPETSTMKNVTAIGGLSWGISLDANGFNWTVLATNVVARGGFQDIATTRSNAGTIAFTLDHSNYANISAGAGTTITAAGSGTNQTAAPVFVNAAGGDFHQTPSSPTIDRGADSPFNGLTDFEGKPRLFGAHTDIGADEYAPPSVLSESASSITEQGAVLAGIVNTEGGVAHARIDYGPTADYGLIAATDPPALSASPQTVSATIGGLQPLTTIHYRVVVTNGSGTAVGPDQVFTTAGSTGPTGLRARALKKCKKKHRKRARKRCKRKARKLPV